MAEAKKSSALAILIAWLVVLIPAAWGVYNVGKQAGKLFSNSPAPASQSAPATSPSR